MLSRIIAVLTLAALAVPLVTSAQDYPNRPVRLMAFAPGTTSDIIGRMFADKLTQQIGHGVEAQGKMYCCAHCARQSGENRMRDRV